MTDVCACTPGAQARAWIHVSDRVACTLQCPYTILTEMTWMDGRQERSRYSIDVTQPDTLTQRIKEKERQKMAQCEQVKKKKEYEELKECTFTPAIKRAVPKQASGPIVVRGLGRHLELKELAQRQSEEKAERERKAFLTHVTNTSTKPYTVPHPFDLSSNDKKHQVSSRINPKT